MIRKKEASGTSSRYDHFVRTRFDEPYAYVKKFRSARGSRAPLTSKEAGALDQMNPSLIGIFPQRMPNHRVESSWSQHSKPWIRWPDKETGQVGVIEYRQISASSCSDRLMLYHFRRQFCTFEWSSC